LAPRDQINHAKIGSLNLRGARFLVLLAMQATKEQLTSLGIYRDIILQQASKVAHGIGVPQETLQGWTEGKGEPTSEQAAAILDFLKESVK
jgi:hypothetical protein